MVKDIRTIIMKGLNWVKRKTALIALAIGGVEKNSLKQNTDGLEKPITEERRHTQGMLADSLTQGEVTLEVQKLRWRTYKILKAIDNTLSEITGYDKDDMPIVKTKKINKKNELSKIKIDLIDNYPLEMVVDNTEINLGSTETLDNDHINLLDEVKVNKNDNGDVISRTHGEITGNDYYATNKGEFPIKIIREFLGKFDIERYTKKLNIRTINNVDKLLEFYVSKYPDIDDRRTRLFISDIKKAMNNPSVISFLDIKEVNFITYKTIGVDDFLEYQYDIVKLDKIIDFNGHYVIKYLAKAKVNGKDILEGYQLTELDKQYENKEKKKR